MDDGIIAPDVPMPIRPPETYTWIGRLASVLMAPEETFRYIREDNTWNLNGIGGAALLVLFVFALDGIRATPAVSVESALWTMMGSVIFGFAFWLSLAGLIGIAALCLGGSKQNCRAVFVSLGWSLTPWMFMAPIFCYEHAAGSFFSILALIPGTWVLVLQVMALKQTFELNWGKTLLLAVIAPGLLTCYQLLQFGQSVYVSASSMN